MVDTQTQKRGISRKVRAILAGGLVLGVGAAITLAAWNDSEFASGTFTAGSFNLVGSTDGTTFTDHATAGAAAALPFTTNFNKLSPGDVVYAPFAVQLDATTTNDATVAITAVAPATADAKLTYELLSTTTFGCTSGTTGTTLVAAGTSLGAIAGTPAFTLTGATTPQFLCFVVTADSTLTQGHTATATWEFKATSTP